MITHGYGMPVRLHKDEPDFETKWAAEVKNATAIVEHKAKEHGAAIAHLLVSERHDESELVGGEPGMIVAMVKSRYVTPVDDGKPNYVLKGE